jgi:hypothetical protein
MNSRIERRFGTLAVALLLAASVFAQGLYTESSSSGGPLGDKARTAKSYMMPKMYRHEGDDGQAVIIRLDRERFYIVNPAEKTYSEMTFKEMEEGMKKAGEQMDKRMAEMQEKMKDMSEEQRKMVEQMMGPAMGGKGKSAKVDVTGPGEKKIINGYKCAKYTASSDGKDLLTMWTSKDVKGFESLRGDWEEFSRRMVALSPVGGKGIAEAFRKIDGFPLHTEMMGVTTVVTKIEKRSTPASQFEIPDGYTQTDSPLKKMGQ